MKLILTILVAASALSSLQAGVFAKLGDIKGELSAPGYEGWSEIRSLNFTGAVFDGEAGTFEIVKEIDRASPLLLKALKSKRFLGRVTISLTEPDSNVPNNDEREFARLLLRDVKIFQSQQETITTESGEVEIQETFLIRFRSIFYRYFPVDSPAEATFADLSNGQDSDSDGMSDAFEDFFNLNKNFDDASLDSDGDGLTHLEEFRLGLNPRLASSSFVPKGEPDPNDPQKFRLTWATKPTKRYQIFRIPNLNEQPILIKEVTASELDTSESLTRNQSRGFFVIKEVLD